MDSVTKFGIRIKRYVDLIPRKRKGVVHRYYSLNDTGMKLHKKHLEELEKIPEKIPDVNENVNIVTKEENKDIPQHAPIGKKRMPELKINDEKEDKYI